MNESELWAVSDGQRALSEGEREWAIKELRRLTEYVSADGDANALSDQKLAKKVMEGTYHCALDSVGW